MVMSSVRPFFILPVDYFPESVVMDSDPADTTTLAPEGYLWAVPSAEHRSPGDGCSDPRRIGVS